MDKDRVEGKAKDIAGRVERQVGEWTGDKEAQVKGRSQTGRRKSPERLGQGKGRCKEAQHNAGRYRSGRAG